MDYSNFELVRTKKAEKAKKTVTYYIDRNDNKYFFLKTVDTSYY